MARLSLLLSGVKTTIHFQTLNNRFHHLRKNTMMKVIVVDLHREDNRDRSRRSRRSRNAQSGYEDMKEIGKSEARKQRMRGGELSGAEAARA